MYLVLALLKVALVNFALNEYMMMMMMMLEVVVLGAGAVGIAAGAVGEAELWNFHSHVLSLPGTKVP